jgi:hypothetical protein
MHESELMKVWLKALFAGLDSEVDEITRDSILGYCGEACAKLHNSIVQQEISVNNVKRWIRSYPS